jgi:hypothetical protein
MITLLMRSLSAAEFFRKAAAAPHDLAKILALAEA